MEQELSWARFGMNYNTKNYISNVSKHGNEI